MAELDEENTLLRCRKCKIEKFLVDFPRDRTKKRGRRSICTECQNRQYRIWYRHRGGKAHVRKRRQKENKTTKRLDAINEKRKELGLKPLKQLR